ncbi:hypothetical protein LOZ58_000591 [Ophidiomyces ophidiicola]|nr:hypothetical protein LOZ58_000591 [Ophidiomyces ophidiicola]
MLEMNTLNDTTWDVLISGTGLPQSLLALALSRSGKRVLHTDKNDHYGGPDAALSLQEAEDWAKKVNEESTFGPFECASVWRLPTLETKDKTSLSFSRAYTLSLSPQIIYTRSKLLSSLVSSRIYRQLEFQAVGSWWVSRHGGHDGAQSQTEPQTGKLQRVPGSREDVFADDTLTMKSKRSLMKLLRYLSSSDEGDGVPSEESSLSLPDFLHSMFQIPSDLYDPLSSLCLSLLSLSQISAGSAIPKIKRHLQSIGVFGPGFSSVLPKWGGCSEIAQVACRACAVGGGIYALNKKLERVQPVDGSHGLLDAYFADGERVSTNYLVGSEWDLPTGAQRTRLMTLQKVSRCILIVSSPLDTVFPSTSENGPASAAAVVIAPGTMDEPPVYLTLHSSDTGECPLGQCIIYGAVLQAPEKGQPRIDSAVKTLLDSVDPTARVLWKLQYTQLGCLDTSNSRQDVLRGAFNQTLLFSPPYLDLEFNDCMIDEVRHVWKEIMGEDVEESKFLLFEDREDTSEEPPDIQ